MVPVIRNVEAMNYADIERTISELGEKVKWKSSMCVSCWVREEESGKARLPSGQLSGNGSCTLLAKVCRARDWQSHPGARG